MGNGQGKQQAYQLPIQKIDLNKFSGLWYEIARVPSSFEPENATNVTAEYTLMPQGSLQVVNTEMIGGKTISIKGVGVSQDFTNSHLKIYFPTVGVTGEYNILETDYSYALVAGGGDKIWILSRKNTMDYVTYGMLLNRLHRLYNYNVEKIMPTKQT